MTAISTAAREGQFEGKGWRVRKDGTRFWASVVIDAIREDGKLIGFAKITRDMTERMNVQVSMQEMQEQLAAAQRMESIDQLSGGIAHDFNNLLMIIMGNLEIGACRRQPDRGFDPGFVKQSDGHVKIYSEPNLGTTLKIYLPRMRDTGPAIDADEETSDTLGEGEPGETIMVVEDNDDLRAHLVQTLRSLHYRVIGAQGGVLTLPLLGRPEIRIDLLLTDVVMKGMNGRELADRARELRPGLKVLFMNGYSRNSIVTTAGSTTMSNCCKSLSPRPSSRIACATYWTGARLADRNFGLWRQSARLFSLSGQNVDQARC